MSQATIVPRVAFVLNLGVNEASQPDTARLKHLTHLFQGHRLPATWVVEDAQHAKMLAPQRTASPITTEVALAIEGLWSEVETPPTVFRKELNSRCAAVRAAAESSIELVAGCPQQLRTKASLLSEQGIRGILSSTEDRNAPNSRSLPCGLWQLEYQLRIPQKRSITSWFSTRSVSLKKLISADASRETAIVAVDTSQLGNSSARSLQAFEKMLREVSWAASRNQIAVTTAGAVIAELSNHRAVKPQRSILKVAA